MVKVRVMGTPDELQQFRRFLLRMAGRKEIEVMDISGMYVNRDTNTYYRMYAQINTPGKEKYNGSKREV